MSTRPRPLVAGNWKMNGLRSGLDQLVRMRDAAAAGVAAGADLLVCPPATLIAAAAALCAGSRVAIGGQDCHSRDSGAHTGEISATMLADAGARFVIVGHSERRVDHGETDALVRAKAAAAQRAGLTPIVCVGETWAERDAGTTLDVLGRQLAGSLPPEPGGSPLAVAYEPIWAIGTGLTPTVEAVALVHGFIRRQIAGHAASQGLRILYGGSVKPANAAELLAIADVDGALVGGASLTAEDFMGIAGVCR